MKETELTRVFDGNILAFKRKENNMTQKNVASLIGVDIRTYQFWEYGSNVPSSNNLLLLSKVLNCSIDDFFIVKEIAKTNTKNKRSFNAAKYNELRKEHGYSQEELAIKLDVSVSSIRKWGSNIRVPSHDNIEKLAKLFNCKTDDFYIS